MMMSTLLGFLVTVVMMPRGACSIELARRPRPATSSVALVLTGRRGLQAYPTFLLSPGPPLGSAPVRSHILIRRCCSRRPAASCCALLANGKMVTRPLVSSRRTSEQLDVAQEMKEREGFMAQAALGTTLLKRDYSTKGASTVVYCEVFAYVKSGHPGNA